MTVTEVNQLLDRFEDARAMMKQMAGGMGLPPGMRRAKAAAAKKAAKKAKGASRKGNPAARAAQAQAQQAAAQARRQTPASPFALPSGPPGAAEGALPDLSALRLPPGGLPAGPPPRHRGR